MTKLYLGGWRVQERHKKYVKKWAKKEKLSESQIIRNMIDARYYGKLHFPLVIIEKLETKCEGNCGKNVDWIVRDDEGENPQVALSVQCSYCAKLNIKQPI